MTYAIFGFNHLFHIDTQAVISAALQNLPRNLYNRSAGSVLYSILISEIA